MATVATDEDIRIEKLTLGPWGTNAYIVVCPRTQQSVLIDTPAEPDSLLEALKGTTPQYILMTHNHMDHLGALPEMYDRLKVPLCAHADDAGRLPVKPERLLADGDILRVGELDIEVLHTPGHTPGSLCFKAGRYLISGDTLFTAGPGKTATPEALAQIIRSLKEKIFVLPDDTPVHPGHGDSTVLAKEKAEFEVFASRPHPPELCGDIVWLTS